MFNKMKSLKVLNIIHKAMLTGQVLLSTVLFYIIYAKLLVSPLVEMDRIFQVIAIVLAASGFLAGLSFFKKRLIQIKEIQPGVKEKFALYRSACIIQWALLEGPCVFSLVSFFLIGNYAFLALAGGLIILFALQAPSKDKIVLQLGISGDELDNL